MNENENQNEIREALGAGIGAEPPITGGPAAVFAGARSRVLRTRAVTGALSVVAVLGVTAGAVAFSGGSGGPGKADQAAAPGAAVADTSSNAKPTGAPTGAPSSNHPPVQVPYKTPTAAATSGAYHGPIIHNPAPVPGAGQVLTDGRSVGEIVKSLLPAGLVTGNYAGQDSYHPSQFGVRATGLMSLDDGSGRLTTVYAAVAENGMFAFADMNCPTEQGFDSRISDCQTSPQADGSVVLTYRTDDYVPDTNGPTKGTYSLTALRAFPNGMTVSVATCNYFDPLDDPHEKGWHVAPSRHDLLLTMDQLKAMLTDSRWGLTVPAGFAQQAKHDLMPYVDWTQKN